jgi:hypothetical protein
MSKNEHLIKSIMKNIFLTTCIAVVIAGTCLTSCKKNSSSPASSSAAQLSIGVKSDNATVPIAASTASITWTSGTANVSEFKFEAKKHGLEIEVTSKNLTHVDLFSLAPSLIGVTIDTGTYTEIEIKAEFTKSSTTDLPLTLKGNFMAAGGTVVPIEFDFNDNAEIKAEAQNVVVDGKTDLTTFITMHLNELLANVTAAELGAATLTNGTIVISSTSNTNIYDQIRADLSTCGHSDGFQHHDMPGNHN